MKKITLLIIVSLLSFCGYAQLPNESFEDPWVVTPGGSVDAAPPGGWLVLRETPGLFRVWRRQAQNLTTNPPLLANSGTNYAFMERQTTCPQCDVPKDWLVTKSFNNPTNGQLRFFSKLTIAGEQFGLYKVKIFTEGPGKDPNNFADYTDLAVYESDAQLQTIGSTWTEKVINMPAFVGNVRVAFIMEGSAKDSWLIDDVSCTAPCNSPSNITVTDRNLTSVTVNWTSNSNATQWELDVVPVDAAGPSGNWKTYNGTTTSYIYGLAAGEALTADTDYKVYIRAVCLDGGRSTIANPVIFSTAALGERCGDPLVIPSPLPYTTTNNTGNFANNYLGAPGTSCSTTVTYLQGNDVVYKYTPDVTGNIYVSVTGNSANTGMFIYANCADIGNVCVNGVTVGATAGPLTIPSLAVTAGTPIFIVISGTAAAATTPYTLTLQQIYCAAPTAATVTSVTSSAANLSWAAGVATEWQVAVRPAGTAGLPTGGTTYTSATPQVNTTTAPTVGGLAPSTNYEYYVRASCGNGNYSIWIGPIAFSTTQIPTGLPFTDNFETTPSPWTLNNGTQVNKWAIGPAATVGNTSGGSGNALFVSNDNGINNLYTITSTSVVQAYRDVTIPAGAASLNLSFDWRSLGQSAVDYVRVYLAPTTVTPTSGTQVPNVAANIKVGGDLSNSAVWSTSNTVINLPAGVAGTTRRLIFEWNNNINTGTQPPAAIDNVNLSVITCPAPISAATIQAGTLAATSVGLTWGLPTATPSTGYDVYLGPSTVQPGANPTSVAGTTIVTTATTNSVTINAANNAALTPSQSYYVWVRSNCGNGDKSTWTGPFFFVAPQIPAGMDYTQNFDGATHEWALNNGAQINKWAVGTAVNNGGTKSLYISNDNGVTNNYTTTTATTNVVQAYRDIQMPAAVDQLELSFDWKNTGEATDFFRVWIINTDFTPTPGTPVPTAAGRLLIPSTPNPFANTTNWTNFKYIIQGSTGYAGTTKRLVFEWTNGTTGGVAPPAAIDNINLKVVPCPAPSAPLLSSLTATQVNFSWTAPVSGATAYQYILTNDTNTPSATPPAADLQASTTTTGQYNNLPPSTTYYFWVRTDCGTSKSYWTGPVKIVTPQIPAAMDYTENFDGASNGYQLVNDLQTNKWFIGSATSKSGPNSLYISNNNGAANTYTSAVGTNSIVHAYRDIQLPAAVTDLSFTFDWKNTGEAGDILKVWMVPIDYIPASGFAINAVANQRVAVGTASYFNNGGWKTENFIFNANAFQGQARRLVFEWTNNTFTENQAPAAIDNIRLAAVTCYPPTNLTMPSNNGGGSTLAWTAPATGTPASYEYYYAQSTNAPTATTAAVGSIPATSITLAGLQHSSNYYFWVRSNCGANGNSVWVGPIEINTAQVASTLPYIQNFDGVTHGWNLKNGNGTSQNRWTVGTATSNSPNKSMYISDTNGETNNYNFNVASYVHAYKDFVIPANATALDLSFDWKGMGSTGDYLRVYRVPTTYVPTTGTAMAIGTLPAGSQLITGTILRNSANWTTAAFTLDPTGTNGWAGTNQRLIFEWSNDAFTGPQTPVAVDNIDLQVITCPRPTGLSVTGVTTGGATFNWNEAGTATAWEVYVTPTGQASPTAATAGIPVTSTLPNPHSYNYTTPPLQPSTNYGFYVRSVCGTNDKSKWTGPFAFVTPIANDECAGAYTLGVNEINHNCEQSAVTSYAAATPSSTALPCANITNGADIWYEFVATGDRHNIELSEFALTTTTAQPIVISLYQGQDCGILQPLSCSFVNVLQAKNLIPGTTYKVRLTINAATPNLAATFKVCINTPNPLLNGGSACTVTTINPGFEIPVLPFNPTSGDYRISQNAVQGWRTTAPDGLIEFWPTANYQTGPTQPSYEGNAYVELNANFVAGLYQDFETPNPTTFTVRFAHKGRLCTDKLELRAGSSSVTDATTLPLVMTAETGNTAWVVYTGTYTSPPGQPVTRFIFLSASACNGDATVGNLLDDIRFTADNSIVNYGPENLTCADNILTVEAAGSGEWGPAPGNPSEVVITDITNPTTTMSGFSKTGDYTFYWTSLYCRSELTVHYDNGDVPAPLATTQIDYCVGATATAVTATPLAGHTLNWYTTATGGTADATAPTPVTTTAGSTIYYVSQTAPDSCESPRTAITVTVHAIPTAPIAATTYNYCEDATAIPLSATVFTNHTLNWYTVPTGGTASPTTPTPSTQLPEGTTGTVTTVYYVSQTSQFGCESNRTAITINVTAAAVPITEFTLPATVCISDPNPTAQLVTGATPGGYFSGAGGLLIDPTTGEIDLTQSVPGQYTVKYTVDPDASVCNPGGSTSKEIIVTPLAVAVTTFSYTTPVCASTANQLPVTPANFSTGGVYGSSTGLSIDTATGEINPGTSTPGDYIVTYQFTGNVADCTADGMNSTNITIVRVFEPVVEFSYDPTYCYDAATATPDLDPAFTTGGSFSGTPGLAVNGTTGAIDIAASTPGQHTVTYNFNADTVNCVNGGSDSATFVIGTELPFVFNGECNGIAFIVTASPDVNSSFEDNNSLSYQWATTTGSPVGTNDFTFNVSDYASSTPGEDIFPMDFALTITDANGCETTRTYTVEGIGCSIQKGISPNNDGKNDYFDLEFMGVKKLSIFNRYGQEVYTKGNYKKEWIGQGKNGDELPTGTYYYVIERAAGGTDTGWIYINRQE